MVTETVETITASAYAAKSISTTARSRFATNARC